MKNLSEKSIPFFGVFNDSYVIYILSDKVLGFGNNPYQLNIWTSKAAYLLSKLMQCKQAEKIFPAKLQLFITGKIDNSEIKNEELFGREEIYNAGVFCDYCFNFDISLDFKLEKPVILQEITYQRHPIDRKLFLSLEEAVLILANICASYTAYQLGHKLVTINTEKQLTEQIFQPAEARIHSKSSFKFSVYYFKYIQHLLQEQRISPKQVLNYCGLDVLLPFVELPPVFSFLEQVMNDLLHPEGIPEPQLIIYYVFLERAYANIKSMKDDQKITILLEYYLKNERTLNLLRSRIERPLPNLSTDLWKIQSF